MMGRTGKKKQSLIMKVVLSPMRILKRARQLYMKGMEDCAGEIGYGGLATFPVSHYHLHPHHQSLPDIKPLRARFEGGSTIEQRILKKVDIIKNMNNGDYENQRRQLKEPISVKHNGMIRRNLGRIDEDRPCNFEED